MGEVIKLEDTARGADIVHAGFGVDTSSPLQRAAAQLANTELLAEQVVIGLVDNPYPVYKGDA
jgi:hypothetical protein